MCILAVLVEVTDIYRGLGKKMRPVRYFHFHDIYTHNYFCLIVVDPGKRPVKGSSSTV